jgi:hypothetical protein
VSERVLAAIAIALIMAALPQAASANGYAVAQHRRMLVEFRGFLQQYPEIATALQAMPLLVRDSAFLSGHQELQAYLSAKTHRRFAKQLQSHPNRIMRQLARLRK